MHPITRIIIIFLFSIALCEVAYFPINRGMLKYHWNTYKRLNEIMNGNTAYDILFIGSSRTYHNVYPRMIDSICQANSYNAGARAARMTEMKMYFGGYCVHHPLPKILVINLDLYSFANTDDLYCTPQYFPFLYNPVVYSTLSEYGNRVSIIKRLPFLGIANFDDASKVNAVKSLLGMKRTELLGGEIEYKGFLSTPSENLFHGIPKNEKSRKIEITAAAVKDLQNIIDTCKTHHVKLIFTYAPEYGFYEHKKIINSKEIINFINQFAKKNNINFIQYDSLPMCNDVLSFYDGTHLSKEGAIAYSRIQAQDLKAIMARGK